MLFLTQESCQQEGGHTMLQLDMMNQKNAWITTHGLGKSIKESAHTCSSLPSAKHVRSFSLPDAITAQSVRLVCSKWTITVIG